MGRLSLRLDWVRFSLNHLTTILDRKSVGRPISSEKFWKSFGAWWKGLWVMDCSCPFFRRNKVVVFRLTNSKIKNFASCWLTSPIFLKYQSYYGCKFGYVRRYRKENRSAWLDISPRKRRFFGADTRETEGGLLALLGYTRACCGGRLMSSVSSICDFNQQSV